MEAYMGVGSYPLHIYSVAYKNIVQNIYNDQKAPNCSYRMLCLQVISLKITFLIINNMYAPCICVNLLCIANNKWNAHKLTTMIV